MLKPMTTPQRCRLLLGLLTLGSLWQTPPLQAEELYTLKTTCSTSTEAQPFACTVTALNVNDTTEYHHRFGGRSVAYRVIDNPYVRIEGRQAGTPWNSVKSATINFKTQELCFNKRAFCVNNPTFLADVLVNSGDAMQGRTQVGMAFGRNGRVDVACFDEGCTRLLEILKR
jgi:hypothetical protein|tara:strand:- start:308 stop:820 length:513 start_codon:yes stop_codon:yes gene_type:complete